MKIRNYEVPEQLVERMTAHELMQFHQLDNDLTLHDLYVVALALGSLPEKVHFPSELFIPQIKLALSVTFPNDEFSVTGSRIAWQNGPRIDEVFNTLSGVCPLHGLSGQRKVSVDGQLTSETTALEVNFTSDFILSRESTSTKDHFQQLAKLAAIIIRANNQVARREGSLCAELSNYEHLVGYRDSYGQNFSGFFVDVEEDPLGNCHVKVGASDTEVQRALVQREDALSFWRQTAPHEGMPIDYCAPGTLNSFFNSEFASLPLWVRDIASLYGYEDTACIREFLEQADWTTDFENVVLKKFCETFEAPVSVLPYLDMENVLARHDGYEAELFVQPHVSSGRRLKHAVFWRFFDKLT